MSKKVDVLGHKFGLLRVVSQATANPKVRWLCDCDCGEQVTADSYQLRHGHKSSCGCDHAKPHITHGLSTIIEYRTWVNIKSRCENPNTPKFENYGGRGIYVCDRWKGSFTAFYGDMGPRPSSRHSLDRVDVNGPYSPENCRWATQQQQARNTRSNRIVTLEGKQVCLAEAVEAKGLKYNTVLYRILRGASTEEALR